MLKHDEFKLTMWFCLKKTEIQINGKQTAAEKKS